MIDFIGIANKVNETAEGIFLAYHIEKLEVKALKQSTKVKAVIVNDWNLNKYTYTFDWTGSRLECLEVKAQ